jgi:UDP-glucuronate 4-epimerase
MSSVEYDAAFDVFNLGNCHPVKLLELVQELERALDKRAVVERLPPQPGDVPVTWADISKARRRIAYEPRTTLSVGIERFVKWLRR